MEAVFFLFLSSGLFLGWSLGASDASNIFGTAIGTKMVKFRTAAIIASVFVIIGAVYAGAGTTRTLNELGSVNTIAGAFMVALAAGMSIYLMTNISLPVSTSQAIVGAIIGWNIYSEKPTEMTVVSKIVSTWVLCPILAGVIAILLYLALKSLMRRFPIHMIRQDMYLRVGLILAGAFGAYALGANNIGNVMGVFVPSSPLQGFDILGISLNSAQVLFLIGGIAISVGIMTYSRKVIDTIGEGLMLMSPVMALVVVVAQGVVLVLFSSKALEAFLISHGLPALPLVPVSSTQAVIGAVMGIGLLKGGRGIRWSVFGKIAIGWVITPAIAALICFISLFFLENVFRLPVFV